MPKIVTSPVKRFSGTVTLSDPLTYPQYFAVEDAFKEVRRMREEAEANDQEVSPQRYNAAVMVGIVKCIEDHNLKDVPKPLTVENFPASPGAASMNLAAWLTNEVVAMYTAEQEDPNG